MTKSDSSKIILCSLIASCLFCHACNNGKQTSGSQDKGAQSVPQSHNIEIKSEVIGKREFGKDLHITGHIEAESDKETEISPRFGGRVLEVKVKQGDEVQAGDVLCVIDSHELSSLQAELIEAKSKLRIAQAHEEREKQILHENLQRPKALNEARTRHEQSKVHLQLAESDYKRVEGLYKEKIASEKDYIASQAAFKKAKLEEKEALTELQREEKMYENKSLLSRDLQLAQAETQRDKQHMSTLKQRLELAGMSEKTIDEIIETGKIVAILPVKTRVPGTLTLVDTAVGEMVTPEKHVFIVTDLSKVAVSADLPEVDLTGIKKGSPVKVKVASYPDKLFTAQVTYISDIVNPETHTLAVRAILDNSQRLFKVNMSADIFLSMPPRSVLAVPRTALRSFNKGKIVFVKEGKEFRDHHVELGADDEDYYEVVSGLKEGDEVVTQGSLALKSELMHDGK